jgi:hypothetical protein
VGPEKYFWMWWVVAGYYGLAVVGIQAKSFGIPFLSGGSFSDARDNNGGTTVEVEGPTGSNTAPSGK